MSRGDDADDIHSVTCPWCGHEQADFGAAVACEACGEGPMPHHDADGSLED